MWPALKRRRRGETKAPAGLIGVPTKTPPRRDESLRPCSSKATHVENMVRPRGNIEIKSPDDHVIPAPFINRGTHQIA